jgi:hypothetical protein
MPPNGIWKAALRPRSRGTGAAAAPGPFCPSANDREALTLDVLDVDRQEDLCGALGPQHIRAGSGCHASCFYTVCVCWVLGRVCDVKRLQDEKRGVKERPQRCGEEKQLPGSACVLCCGLGRSTGPQRRPRIGGKIPARVKSRELMCSRAAVGRGEGRGPWPWLVNRIADCPRQQAKATPSWQPVGSTGALRAEYAACAPLGPTTRHCRCWQGRPVGAAGGPRRRRTGAKKTNPGSCRAFGDAGQSPLPLRVFACTCHRIEVSLRFGRDQSASSRLLVPRPVPLHPIWGVQARFETLGIIYKLLKPPYIL